MNGEYRRFLVRHGSLLVFASAIRWARRLCARRGRRRQGVLPMMMIFCYRERRESSYYASAQASYAVPRRPASIATDDIARPFRHCERRVITPERRGALGGRCGAMGAQRVERRFSRSVYGFANAARRNAGLSGTGRMLRLSPIKRSSEDALHAHLDRGRYAARFKQPRLTADAPPPMLPAAAYRRRSIMATSR